MNPGLAGYSVFSHRHGQWEHVGWCMRFLDAVLIEDIHLEQYKITDACIVGWVGMGVTQR